MELRDARGLTESEYLKQYKRKDYPRPSFTVDIAVFSRSEFGNLKILMVRRGGHPFLGGWALPGGFVGQDEDANAAALRELHEETGVADLQVEQLGVYSAPGRDPRGWTVSAAFLACSQEGRVARAGDDAAEAVWCCVTTRIVDNDTYEMEISAGEDTLHSVFKASKAQFANPRSRMIDSNGFAFDHAQIIADAWLALSDPRNHCM